MASKKVEWLPETAPTPFEDGNFKELWLTLLGMAKWKKKPLSAIEMACKRLKKFDVGFATILVENSIEGNYQGVVFSDSEIKYQQYKQRLNGTQNIRPAQGKPVATTHPKGGFGKL